MLLSEVSLYPFIQVHSALMLRQGSDSREHLIYRQPQLSNLTYMVGGAA